MAYRSLTSAHPLAFSYPGGASSSDGPAGPAGPSILLEQSPARSKAPSDGPSEFSSWHDDASSSLAPSGTARDGTITVNPLIMRMGDHLKGKLQGMIRQRFENYLHIIKTLQNDIGKLAALTCELRMADHHASAAAGGGSSIRVSISCNEDGTFVVYTVPDAAGVLGSQCSTPASSEGSPPHSTAAAAPELAVDDSDESSDLLGQWVHKVCEFGMSGRCHSLTALFHFGYTTWKQLMHGIQSAWGMESVEDVSPGHIAEEEERAIQEVPKEEALSAEDACAGLSSNPASCDEGRSPEQLLSCARSAAESERLRQAVDLCCEALDLLWSRFSSCPAQPTSGRSLSLASSSSSAPAPAAAIWRGVHGDVLVPEESSSLLCELLCLRASAHTQMQQYADALFNAEEVSGIQPTCADGYYWQYVALQGMGREQEALEALMSALEYEPQNAFYQQLLTALFEDMSDNPHREGGGSRPDVEEPARAAEVLPRPRGARPRDALSTTTQATHLSSRSTTPTEVSEVVSRSSSNDSLYVDSAAFEENA